MRCLLRVLTALAFVATLLLGRSAMAVEPGSVTPEEGKILIRQIKDLVILDVRDPHEYVVVHYPNALNIPANELETRFSEVPVGKPVLMHCIKGKRSQRGYEILKAKRPDIKELYYIKGEPIFN